MIYNSAAALILCVEEGRHYASNIESASEYVLIQTVTVGRPYASTKFNADDANPKSVEGGRIYVKNINWNGGAAETPSVGVVKTSVGME